MSKTPIEKAQIADALLFLKYQFPGIREYVKLGDFKSAVKMLLATARELEGEMRRR